MVISTLPTPTPFASKVAGIAQDQHTMFGGMDEDTPKLSAQIKKYWTTLQLPFPGVSTAWASVFISFCVQQAGATSSEFKFAAAHAVFVHEAIQNARSSSGVFRAFPISAEAANIGDIIQNNRSKGTVDYRFAENNTDYISHSVIVIQRGVDSVGKFALVVGGNEGDSIRKTTLRLNSDGSVKQKATHPFICIIKNLK